MPDQLAEPTFDFSLGELASLILCVVFLSSWQAASSNGLYPSAFGFFACLSFFSWLSGRIFVEFTPFFTAGQRDFNLYFLSGFLCLNTVVYFAFMLLPVRVGGTLVVICLSVLAGAVLHFRTRRFRLTPFQAESHDAAALLTLFVILASTTLWSRSSIRPVVETGDVTIFKPWLDYFYHAHKVADMASARGFMGMSNIYLSNSPAPLYHYASFVFPASLSSLTLVPAYQAATGFWTPTSLLLTGLGAYVLVGSIFSPWGGFTAATLIFLLPDPSQIGLANDWLSYHWLQQIAPSGGFGIALMCLAWVLIFEGCRRPSVAGLLLGVFLWGLTGNYKLHIFVANAPLVLLYCAAFFGAPSKCVLGGRVAGAMLILALLMRATELVPAFPLLKLDASALGPYTAFVISMFESDSVARFFSLKISTPFEALNQSWTGVLRVAMIMACTFGPIAIIFPLSVVMARKSPHFAAVFIFPAMCAANYLIMSLALAYDSHLVAMPDEFLHRPFVWAYVVVVGWTGALLHQRFSSLWNPGVGAKWIAAAAGLFLFAIPAHFGKDLQVGPSLKWGDPILANIPVPTGFVEACEFIRASAAPEDILLDSTGDERAVATALTERQNYVMNYSIQRRIGAPQLARIEEAAHVQLLTDPKLVLEFFSARGIRWYILHPESRVLWRDALRQNIRFESRGYRVFSFAPHS